jgi:hypothetical protein
MFETAMDSVARLSPDSYHHMYEWGQSYGSRETVGIPQYRLWKLNIIGSGGNREVSFTFLPSHRPTPIEEELLQPGKGGRVVNQEVHIFTWKAMVMEYGMPVTIEPKIAKTLVFVDDETGKLIFTKRTIRTVPGKDKLTGNFTTFYLGWWTGVAPGIFDERIKRRLEEDIIPRDLRGRFRKRSSIKLVSPEQAVRIGVQSYAAGKAASTEEMNKNKIDYIARAHERRMDLYGY